MGGKLENFRTKKETAKIIGGANDKFKEKKDKLRLKINNKFGELKIKINNKTVKIKKFADEIKENIKNILKNVNNKKETQTRDQKHVAD